MTQFTAFDDQTIVAQGPREIVTTAQRTAMEAGRTLVILDDATGQVTDVDLRDTGEPARRGRPRLGVTAREVTLLPRHWDWLADQRGGASAALRRLVEAALRAEADKPDPRRAQEATYRVLHAVAGDLPGYEEALRALFAQDLTAFAERMADWPEGLRTYALKMAGAI